MRIKKLFRALYPRNIHCELAPTHHLRPTPSNPLIWETLGHTPYFLLNPTRNRYPTGWVRIRFAVQCPVKAFVSFCLYMDTGQGFHEGSKVDLPILAANAVDRIVYLPPDIRGLKLTVDSADRVVQFKLSPLIFSKISKLEAQIRMLVPLLKAALGRRDTGLLFINRAFFYWRTSGWRGLKDRLADSYVSGRQANVYKHWIASFDSLSDQDRKIIKRHIQAFSTTPLISVIMPVYNTPEKFLRRAMDSVCEQLYPYWELCIADDASQQPHIKTLLNEYRARDPRIKVIFRNTNDHISAASNSALKIAQGEFIALLDHDDELTEHALYMVATEINTHPHADIIYSDEDKIDTAGIRADPHFKSDWNPDLFYAQNYVCHLGVYRTSLVNHVGGFRQGYEGSQDYDLCLRCVHATKSTHIRHIPHVLYHWRVLKGSTALDVGEKSYAERAALKMLREYFHNIDPRISVEIGNFSTTYRIRYALPTKPPLVSLIIPTRDGYHILKRCIDSILAKTTYPHYEIIIVDNQSQDPQTLAYFDKLTANKKIRIVGYNHPFNFSRINNYSVQQAKGSIIGLINNDIEVISGDWLEEMVSQALRPEIGAVGAKLLYSDKRLQHGGIITGIAGTAGHSHKGSLPPHRGYFGKSGLVQNISAVTAACLIIRKALYEYVGGLEEDNLAIAFNDVDFCLRVAAAGYRNLWTPYAELYHHESLSRGYEDTPEKIARFEKEAAFLKKRWGKKLLNDPYYSPNLTLANESFAFANPPRVSAPWLAFEKQLTDKLFEGDHPSSGVSQFSQITN